SNAAELRDAYDAVVDNATRFTAEGSLDGVLVQQMISDAVAEAIVGVIVDPGFGPAIVFGLGGTFVELLKDRALGIPPFTEEEAKELIAQTRVSRLLRGFRDRPPGDEQALVRTLIQVGRFALDWQDRIHTVDINPLLVRPQGKGVIVADALIEASPISREEER
ncbi:CoA-binding protein, partial [Candidatus Acetothermia bacterium]